MAKALLLALALLFSGCAVIEKAASTAKVAAVGNERYLELAQKALDGTAEPDTGVLPISKEAWANSPKPVRLLVERLVEALEGNRYAFYSIAFQLDRLSTDPNLLNLPKTKMPEESPLEDQ